MILSLLYSTRRIDLTFLKTGNPKDKKEIKENHFDQVYESLSLENSKTIDWDDSTDKKTAMVDKGSIVFYCEHGTPGTPGKSCGKDIIAETWSQQTGIRYNLQFATVGLCPMFFELESAEFASAMWQRDRSSYFPTRGGTILHECQHIHQITGNSRHCVDVTVEHNGKTVWCYSPEAYVVLRIPSSATRLTSSCIWLTSFHG